MTTAAKSKPGQRVRVVISEVVCGSCCQIMQPDPDGYTCFNVDGPDRGQAILVGLYVRQREAREIA